jgi:hypothetical protein
MTHPQFQNGVKESRRISKLAHQYSSEQREATGHDGRPPVGGAEPLFADRFPVIEITQEFLNNITVSGARVKNRLQFHWPDVWQLPPSDDLRGFRRGFREIPWNGRGVSRG